MTVTLPPKLDDPTMTQEANAFALLLVQNKDLLLAWFDALVKGLKDKTYETQIMDNFIADKKQNKVRDFNTTFAYVIQAQQKLAAYQMYYWSGLYKTTKKPANAADGSKPVDGSPVSVAGSGNKNTATFVSFAKSELVNYTFKNLVLSWDTADGLNSTSGNLIFGLRNISGVSTKTFAGTITEAGTKSSYFGLMVDPKSEQGKQQARNTPPQTSEVMQNLQFANQIINMVSQTLFMAVNMAMLWKAGKEIQELRGRLAKGEPVEKDLESAEAEQSVNERAGNQAVDNADDIRGPVDEMSDEDFSIGSEDASPFTESSELPDIDAPSDMGDLELSESEADTVDQSIESEIEDSGEDFNGLDEGGGSEADDEGGFMEDGEDVVTTDIGDFVML
jgi:hypothetical protein